MKNIRWCLVLAGFFLYISVQAQKGSHKKYPSLFWEISGNGLKKPSYLFGTMHVSSKMVFHLSDSFYHALRSVDVVALELNPEKWQGDMFEMQKAQKEIYAFSNAAMSDYINENSFKLFRYEENIKRALNEEPTLVNSLLYRNYQPRADFEENTYLDLYIYQTGRKLGKAAAGVEDYQETERILMEAYQDMARDRQKRQMNTDGESMFDLNRRMQEAYRKGDLDLMDSLETVTTTSQAFTEKFLYKRNEIQAHSIDTILKKRSAFVGVGAAHLPGPRGVIEILRSKGYRLRPIFMRNRDAAQKDEVDKLRVPVKFSAFTTDDGLVTVKMPGKLFKREEARANESWQYADMNNGAYYMLTRVSNHAAMLGDSEKQVLKKVDSMLYENIPGRILKKKLIEKNGYTGFDITNRTRRGDVQRYNILVTPFEVLVFKMSGNDGYVEGKEAETFFSSIVINTKTQPNGWQKFEPQQGGFSVDLPQTPREVLNNKSADRLDRWEYEVFDDKTGNGFMIWKKSVYNQNFLEEDTFDLSLIGESFRSSDMVDRLTNKQFGSMKGVPYADFEFALKNGHIVKARAIIKGPHYFLLAARSRTANSDTKRFFDSFSFTDYHYTTSKRYSDTLLNFEVNSAVYPGFDGGLRLLFDKVTNDEVIPQAIAAYDNWPKSRHGWFKSNATGEAVLVSVETFPRYYYARDTAKFWRSRIEETRAMKDMVLEKNEYIAPYPGTSGYDIVLADTNTSRRIWKRYLLKDNLLYRISSITDTSAAPGSFISEFFNSFRPNQSKPAVSVFDHKLDLFFADYYSSDSLTRKKANNAISNIFFGKEGVARLLKAIGDLSITDQNYFETKSKLIGELGYIDDEGTVDEVIAGLQNIHQQTADTSYFQNPVFIALSRLKTEKSYAVLKDMLLQDPPVFENSYEYSRLINNLDDSLALSKALFPEILQLAQLEDYKNKLNNLLRKMVDSGYIKGADFQSYFGKLYFDAKVQLKKQQVKDEKALEKQISADEEETYNSRNYRVTNNNTALKDYTVLLMPFYSKPGIPAFYQKLLHSKDAEVQLDAIEVLVKHNKKVEDTVLLALAANDRFRARLLSLLEKMGRTELFPAKYKKQEDIARSVLLNDKASDKFAAISLLSSKPMSVNGQQGMVYFYKYKLKLNDDWKMGISGLQPLNNDEVSSNNKLVKLTERKLRDDEPVEMQFDNQVKRLIFATRKSSRHFFSNPGYRSFGDNDYEEDEEVIEADEY